MGPREREALAKIAKNITGEAADCRRRGRHSYEPLRAIQRGRFLDCTERCSCDYERDVTINADGEYVGEPTIRAPKGYGIKGYGHGGTYVVRAQLRRAYWSGVAEGKAKNGNRV